MFFKTSGYLDFQNMNFEDYAECRLNSLKEYKVILEKFKN